MMVFFILPSLSLADVVVFKTGAARKGVIVAETDTTVKLRTKDGVIGTSRSNIEKIEYATAEENEELIRKWDEEKKQQEEERKNRRQELEKFENEQRAKGLVKIGDEWVSPAEAEKRRQEGIRQQIEAAPPKSTGAEADTQASTEEEGLPEFFQNLNEEEKQQFIENRQRMEKIEVSDVRLDSVGGATVVKGTIANKGDIAVRRVEFEIIGYNEADEVILSDRGRAGNLEPGDATSLYVPVRVESELVKRTEVRILDVSFR
jgi:hypothetical protein